MPLAQRSVIFSILFIALYALLLYFLNKNNPRKKVFMIIYSIGITAFVIYYNARFLGNFNNDNLLKIESYMNIMTPVTYVPLVLSLLYYVRYSTQKDKKINYILAVAVGIFGYFLWNIISNLIFTGWIS